MHFTLPTVAVDMDGSKVIINQSDFNEAVHTLWSDEKQEQEQESVEPEPAEAPKRRVLGKNASTK